MGKNYKLTRQTYYSAIDDVNRKDSGTSTKSSDFIKKFWQICFLLLLSYGSNSAYGQVNTYAFSQSNGTYTEITGGTQLVTCTDCSTTYDTDSFVIALPTPFIFNGANISSVVMRVDGSLAVGSTVASSSSGPIAASTAANGVISALGMDLRNCTIGGIQYELRWQDIGAEYVFQWKNASRWSQNTVERFNFQIRINKTSGNIQVVYGDFITIAASTTYQPQVGLRGGSNADFNNRRLTTTIPDATPSWDNTDVGSSNGHTVRFTSGTPDVIPMTGLTFSWQPTVTCYAPSSLSSTSVTSSGATILYTAPAVAPTEGYEYFYSTTNTAPLAATEALGEFSTATLPLTGLLSNTTYYVWIRSKCDASTKSAWSSVVSFTTQCEAFMPSYSNNFATFPGACWTENNAGTVATGPTGTIGSGGWTTKAYLNSGSNMAATFNLYGSTTLDNHWLISPVINLGTTVDHRLKYDVGLTVYNLTTGGGIGIMGSDSVDVLITTNGGVSWQILKTYNTANSPTNTGMTETIDLSAYTGEVRFAFFVTDNLDATTVQDADFFIDNFLVEAIPSCEAPTALMVSNISNTGATISWTAPSVVPAEGYEIFFSETNVAPAVAGTEVTGTTTNLTLTAATTYYVWVRSVCATGNESAWVALPAFTTLCNPVNTFPYAEGFNTAGTMPTCWKATEGVPGSTQRWEVVTADAAHGAGAASEGAAFMRMNYYNAQTSFNPYYLTTPSFDLTTGAAKQLSFDAWMGATSGSTNHLVLESSSDNGVTWTTLASYTQNAANTTASAPWTSYIIDLSSLNGNTVVFRYKATSNYGSGFCNIAIDNFEISEIQTVDYCNLQFPSSATLEPCQSLTVYAQVYKAGVTEAAGQGAGITAWIGYSETNSDPSTWTNWVPATFNVQVGNNDEFSASLTGLEVGDYFYASRFQYNGGIYSYGGYSPEGGNFWNGTTYVSGELSIVDPVEIMAVSSESAICMGESTTLTASSTSNDYSYTWDNEAGSGASVSVMPMETTTYTVTGLNAVTGCTTTATVTVVVNAIPSDIVIAPADATICEDTMQELVATGGVATGVTILEQNFNDATNDWMTSNNSTGGTVSASAWTLRATGYIYSGTTFASNDASQFYMSNSDAQGSGGNTLTLLESPSFSLEDYTAPSLSFYHYYNDYNAEDSAVVQVSTDGGVTWTNVSTYTTDQGTPSAFVNAIVDLTPFQGQADVKVRFSYTAVYGYYWAIDNISITGTTQQISWTPVTNLYTDAAGTVAYELGDLATTVYAKAVENVVYTATATAATCSVSSTVAITVTPKTVPDFAEIGAVCEGSEAPVLALTSPNGVTGTWSPNVVSTTEAGTYVFTPTEGLCATEQTLVVTITSTPAPTGEATQTFCASLSPTVAALMATGSSIQWYADAADGVALDPTTALVDGTTYHASQTVEGCESIARFAVAVSFSNTVCPNIEYANLQFPGTATIMTGGAVNVYAQVYKAGVTEDAGQGAGISAWIAYSETNSDPSTWTNWMPATFNVQSGNNDEYTLSIGSDLPEGTYYYASRFQYNDLDYVYGGYSATGGGFWDGTNNVNGVLTVEASAITYANLQFPAAIEIEVGESETVYAQVYAQGVTEAEGAGEGIMAWIGYSLTDENPNAASFTWMPATFNTQSGNNDEFSAVIGADLAAGTYYYASRFQLDGGDFVYGGYSATGGGFWDGTANVNGMMTISCGLVAAPTGAAIQDFTTGQTLADFVVEGENITWYDAATDGNMLPESTPLVSGMVYYASQTVGGCESADRLMVTAGEDLRTPGFDVASLKYYPNPVSDMLTVTYSETIDSIEVFNVLGQRVFQKAPNAQEVKIDMSNLASGNYIVNVVSKGMVKNIKVIKK